MHMLSKNSLYSQLKFIHLGINMTHFYYRGQNILHHRVDILFYQITLLGRHTKTAQKWAVDFVIL